MSRETIDRVVRSVYAARQAGDLDGIVRHFAEGACFALAGSAAASPVPMSCTGREPLREALRRLLAGFVFEEMDRLDILIDGDRAAIHHRVRVRSTVTGEVAVTELLDIVRFQDDRIASFTQFADTALAARLLGR